MALQIEQTFARIGVDRSQGQLEMHSQLWRTELHQEQAQINIHSDIPKVIIDQHAAFSSAGLKNTLEISEEAAQNGYQQALSYISKKSADGTMLAHIENRGNLIASIAKRDSTPVQHVFDVDTIPKVGPRIDVVGGIMFDAPNAGAKNGVAVTVIPGGLNINYTPSKVNIYIEQYQSIQFHYEPGGKVDVKR